MNEVIRKMAESLRAGATMLPDNCPVCNSPLFRVKKKTYCIKCGWSSEQAGNKASVPSASSQEDRPKAIIPIITSTVLAKLEKLEVGMRDTSDPSRLSELSELMLKLLEILEALERLEKS